MRVSNVTVRKRLFFVLCGGLIIFLIIAARLGYVQFIIGDVLSKRAENSWSRDIPFEPKRGEILDRNGVALATNKSAPSIVVVPRQIKDPVETTKKLAPILNISEDKLLKILKKSSSKEHIRTEGIKITNEKAKQIRDLQLDGVYIAEDSKRFYPFGNYLSHVLGFAGIDNQGLNGLELYYDDQLKGKKGSVQYYSDAKGKRMPNIADDYTPPINGLNLKLTIDSRINTILERELNNAQAQYNPDSMIAIAENPNTGEILGMSSRPSFDPAEYRTVSPEIYNRNLPVWSNYEPGSTFKIITLAAALNEGLVDLNKESFNDDGAAEVAGARLRCWKRGGHGHQSFLEVVQNSCNPGFVELGNRLGKDRLFKYIRDFGFGSKTGIDLKGEGTGILFNMDRVGPVEQATTAFGQGVSVTPIQQVAAVSAAINGGILYQPYIAKEFVDPVTNEVVSRKTPIAKRRVISSETSKKVRDALESVVAQGTGRNAFVEGYRVGGKTGTAQKVKDGRYQENNFIVSFIGFAPADDPQIVVYVAVDNPKGTVQFGGTVAAPIVGNIIRDSMHVLGIPPRKNQIEKELRWPESPDVKVPNLVGLEKKDLQQMLDTFTIEYSGEGNTILDQSPKAGVKLKEGSKIRIYLGNKAENKLKK
ncbi:stage V sporulation protein D [Bacillus sp. RG28]|uniref:serine-type D-Ala-D-Ala carboxypeptidase n=1 Tax=Gottfriedia endophytica TaxID=2820819 RepID=A0A940NI85_9BACI|nr:stage V sporulation protein D [Gottfriedia endophytica]MBP0724810.1 stage V sporulation protein D [Gottfriedia endophytica]